MATGDKFLINGRWWYEENITIEITGVPVIGVKSIKCDSLKNKVEYLKRNNVKLNYGASNHLPISIDCPKNYDLDKLEILGIDYKNIPRDKWFKY